MSQVEKMIIGYCPHLDEEYFILATYPDRAGWQKPITIHCDHIADGKCKETSCPIEKIANRQMI